MIYVETGSLNACFNLAAEYYFAAEKDLGDSEIFLLWHTTPSLIVGKYQNVLEEVDQAYAAAHGIRIVRRLSGGGTCYLDEGGWQFSFVTRDSAQTISFSEYLAPILTALNGMGVPAEFNGRNDLVIGERKFSGNAQYKLAGCTVHHGTLLFDTDIGQMVASTTVDPEKLISKSIKSVRSRVTNISEHLPEPMSSEAFKRRVIASVLGGSGREYELTEADRDRINAIAGEKFASWESLYGATPKFSLERSARLPGGRMTFSLDVKKGRIEHCGVSGDFFAAVDADAFDAALKGCPYKREAICEALVRAGLDAAVYRVTAREMAELIADQ